MANNSTNGSTTTAEVERALEASYDPRTPNDQRKDALKYLESLMDGAEAPHLGYTLISNHSLPPQTRSFGLTLLEDSLVRRWAQYSSEEAETLRKWVISLVQPLRIEDPAYLRLKIATLWVTLAERTWASTWENLDAMLQELWNAQVTPAETACNQTFVLYVLENLSDNICVREDPIAMLRQMPLGQSLNEVFIPPALHKKHTEDRGPSTDVRSGQDGWLNRICALIRSLTINVQPETQATVVKALASLKPTVAWISLEALVEIDCVDCIAQALASGNEAISIAALELFLAILSRPYLPHFQEPWTRIYRSSISPSRIELVKRIFMMTRTDPDDIDDSKYFVQKKLSEVVAYLIEAATRLSILDDGDHEIAFYQLAIDICKSESLLVSIPILHRLSGLLVLGRSKGSNAIFRYASQLFDTCVERMIKFELLPEHVEHPILSYLREDFETLPEVHAFLGNYRRYCLRIIEILSIDQPVEAIQYMLQQTVNTSKAVEGLDDASYSKHAIPVVQLDANAASVRGGLGGYKAWLDNKYDAARQVNDSIKAEHRREVDATAAALGEHCIALSNISTKSPDVIRTICQLMVDIVLALPKPEASLIRGVVQHILKAAPAKVEQNSAVEEAFKQMDAGRLHCIRHLALLMPDAICEYHEEIFRLLDEIWQNREIDDKLRWGYRGVMVMLVQRSSLLEENSRISRLETMLEPIVQAWTTPEMSRSLQSFDGFCSRIGLDKLASYIDHARFLANDDWPGTKLDADGLQLRAHISDSLSSLPLRMTNSLLSASSETLREMTLAYSVGSQLWRRIMPLILPNVLSLLHHATAFNREESWSRQTPEFQSVMQRMLVDRFWQSGISCETKDEFTARISDSSGTFEGFASTVRGAPRQVRDGCYHIIHGLVRFDQDFFAIPDLAEPLAAALFNDAQCLSTHHLQRLVPLLDRLVTRCPASKRSVFLPPLVTASFKCFRAKLTQEWARIELAQREEEQGQSNSLTEEMKVDSVVRATTHAFVSFVLNALHRPLQMDSPLSSTEASIKNILLTHSGCVEEVLEFSIAALSMQDSRCVAITTHILRHIVLFATEQQDPALSSDLMSAVRRRLCTDALQTSIISLNNPRFVDIQKDLAAFIGAIIHYCAPMDALPIRVLISLQGMDKARLLETTDRIIRSKKERDHRTLVLDLLAGVRAVRISELGKVGIGGNREDAERKRKEGKSKWLTIMERESTGIVRGNTPPEGGLGDLFGGQ